MKQLLVLIALTLLVLTNAWQEVKSFTSQESSPNIKAVAFSKDDTRLYSGGSNGKINVISTTDYSVIKVINVGQPIEFILIHPNEDIYVSTNDSQLRAYSGSNYSLIHIEIYNGNGYAYDMAWADS